jgi:hypothetical protein
LNDGAIGGAGNIASGQVLYGTAAGVAGSSTALTWNGSTLQLTGATFGQLQSQVGDLFVTNNAAAGNVIFRANGVEGFRLASTSRNLLLGTTTDDGTNRLQVAGSGVFSTLAGAGGGSNGSLNIVAGGTTTTGYTEWRVPGTRQAYFGSNTLASQVIGLYIENATSGLLVQNTSTSRTAIQTWQSGTVNIGQFAADGTFTVRNETPTTGTTQLIVRAGAGQSTTNLMTWQNNVGTAVAGISGEGSFFTGNNANATGDSLIDANGLRFGSTVLARWSNNLPVNAADVSLSRGGVNVFQVGDGGSNANGIVSAASYRAPLTTPASATATGTTGTIVWDANYIYIATGTNTWKRAAIATW